MVCLLLTELVKEHGEQFETEITAALKGFLPEHIKSNKDLSLERLVCMQSGLRDYWVLTVLWGATPQQRFSIYEDLPKALQRIGGFHFDPGTQMSYCNVNFITLGLAIERVTGRSLSDLLAEKVFHPAGMKTATLQTDTARIPPPLVGYEGTETTGYIPFLNHIEWAGDAGIMASLEDMIAYEKYLHHCATDEQSAYSKNTREPRYIDGSSANYGFGLRQRSIDGVKIISHGGGLGGFRLLRAHAPEKRMSVIVCLNSESQAGEIFDYATKMAFDMPSTEEPGDTNLATSNSEVSWAGNYFDEEARLAIVVRQEKEGKILVNYAGDDETLTIQGENHATSREMEVTFADGQLRIYRPLENRRFTARLLSEGADAKDPSMFCGQYRSEMPDGINSTFHVTGAGGMLYGAFDGYLGQGPVHIMQHLGENVWWLACFRSLDSAAPGMFTVCFNYSDDGKTVSGATVSHFLARSVQYSRLD